MPLYRDPSSVLSVWVQLVLLVVVVEPEERTFYCYWSVVVVVPDLQSLMNVIKAEKEFPWLFH